jgi:hypothetical protein
LTKDAESRGKGGAGHGEDLVSDWTERRDVPEPYELETDRSPAPRFLVVDPRVPEAIRQLLEEADGCLNMSFTTGGSACARRAIRKTFEIEGVEGDDFASSLRALAQKHEGLPPTLFRVIELLGAGEEPLHVDALKALLATFKGILYEIYVLGEERAESLAYVSRLLQALDREAVPPKKPRTAAFPPRPKQ